MANELAVADQPRTTEPSKARWRFDPETDEFTGDALYFIQECGGGPIKIGRGTASNRLKSLQTGNPRLLKILGTIDHYGFAEAFWHEAFGDIRLRGEWFRPTAHLLKAIECALKQWDWADEVAAPEEADVDRFSDAMLDAYEWYQDQIWMGKPEKESAARAVSIALSEAIAEAYFEIERLSA